MAVAATTAPASARRPAARGAAGAARRLSSVSEVGGNDLSWSHGSEEDEKQEEDSSPEFTVRRTTARTAGRGVPRTSSGAGSAGLDVAAAAMAAVGLPLPPAVAVLQQQQLRHQQQQQQLQQQLQQPVSSWQQQQQQQQHNHLQPPASVAAAAAVHAVPTPAPVLPQALLPLNLDLPATALQQRGAADGLPPPDEVSSPLARAAVPALAGPKLAPACRPCRASALPPRRCPNQHTFAMLQLTPLATACCISPASALLLPRLVCHLRSGGRLAGAHPKPRLGGDGGGGGPAVPAARAAAGGAAALHPQQLRRAPWAC